jgi:oligosaccharide repeat unit polymerase
MSFVSTNTRSSAFEESLRRFLTRVPQSWVRRLVIIGLLATIALTLASVSDESRALAALAVAGGWLLVIVVYRLDYLHPAVAYSVPWLTVVAFSVIPISQYARVLDVETYRLLIAAIFVWQLATVMSPVAPKLGAPQSALPELRKGAGVLVLVAFAVLYALAALNVAVSGYVPLVSAFLAGDSRYLDFGIPSIYGAFLALANALACVAFYIYLSKGSRRYLLLFLSVPVIHLFFVSRQNLVTVLFEAFVIACMLRGRVSRVRVVLLTLAALVLFSILGEFRSGNIKEIVRVTPEYESAPSSLVWLYSYSYFNVLNLENTITRSDAPYFDGTMWQRLLPSVLRPETQHAADLELPAMNVLSYIYPVYLDVGAAGVLIVTACLGFLTSLIHRRAIQTVRFAPVASFACLLFCAAMSFFIDFWFYLPVIFQLFFFWIFEFLFFARAPALQTPLASSDAAATENRS